MSEPMNTGDELPTFPQGDEDQVVAELIDDMESRDVPRASIVIGDVIEHLDDHYSGHTDEDVAEVFVIIEDRYQNNEEGS